MRYEIDLFGILVPALLLWIMLSYAIGIVLRRLLERHGFYRFIWHPALFDLAMYICLLGSVVFLSSEFLS